MSRAAIKTLADLKAACVIDPKTRCWHWQGGTNGGRPAMWRSDLGRACSPGVFLPLLAGKPHRPGQRRYRHCASADCVAPTHWKAKPPPQPCGAQRRASITQSMRRNGKLTFEQVQQIRDRTESLTALAERLGMSREYLCKVRRGVNWKTEPLPQASVFVFAKQGGLEA